MLESNFKNGDKDGKWIEYYENGQISVKGNYKDGNLNGKWIEYYEDGQIDRQENYKFGRRFGKWIQYRRNGDIEREINPSEVVQHLLKHKYCGIANGKAEFGPRALGNRSLIADPRIDIKNTVNEIKRRQKFRPFAPAILEEFFYNYFQGRKNRYMQFVSKAEHDYKSVTHVDGTARVQCVEVGCKSILREILEEWYNETGCPMLLNTSLNIKGQPMVNTWEDAQQFEKEYNVKVF